jgi:hypothetical protein
MLTEIRFYAFLYKKYFPHELNRWSIKYMDSKTNTANKRKVDPKKPETGKQMA